MNARIAKTLKPILEKEMPKWVRVASKAHRRATRRKRLELRQRGLPMIIWKDGKVCEVPHESGDPSGVNLLHEGCRFV